MSYYEARLLRYNPEEDEEDDDAGMGGGTIALIAVGLLAAAGGGYWWYSRSRAQAAAQAEAASAADPSVPVPTEVSTANAQARDQLLAAAKGSNDQIEAQRAYPTVKYLNGTEAVVSKASADQMVASGKFGRNALGTVITEKDPNAPASSGKISFQMKDKEAAKTPARKGKGKKGKKGKK